MNWIRLWLAFLGMACVCPCWGATSWVFVSIAGENRIATYDLDHEHGALTEVSSVAVAGNPGALCLHPSGKYLLASIKSSGRLGSFSIGSDGRLTAINDVAAGADPAFLATDSSGRFLITAYYAAGKVAVHRVNRRGAISDQPLQTVFTAEKAHGVTFGSDDRYVFVPHTGPNAIFQFRFDAKSGRLSANDPARLDRTAVAGPRHLWLHPDGKLAFGSDEQGNQVTAYRLDPTSGTLNLIESVSTLPGDGSFDGRNSTSDIEVHPSGKYVYVANRGHDSIAGFAIDADSGKLKPIGHFTTEPTTRSFNIDTTGRFLIAAGQRSGALAVFGVAQDGSLDRVDTVKAGDRPWWVLIVPR